MNLQRSISKTPNAPSPNSSHPPKYNHSHSQNPFAPDLSNVPGDEVNIIPTPTGPLSPRNSSTSSSLDPTAIPGIGNSPASPQSSPTFPNYEPTSPTSSLSSPEYRSNTPQFGETLSWSSIKTGSMDKRKRRKRSRVEEGDNRKSKRHCNTKRDINLTGTSSYENTQSNSCRTSTTETNDQYYNALLTSTISTNSFQTGQSSDSDTSSIIDIPPGEFYTYTLNPFLGSELRAIFRRHGLNFSSSGSDESSISAAIKLGTSKSENQKALPPPLTNDNDDAEDCVLLGVHPIVKKPPLAVITISSDDEEEESERTIKEERETSSDEATVRDSSEESFDENNLV